MFFVRKMPQNLVFVFVEAICVSCCYYLALGEVVFVQKPQNLTIFDLKKPFFFNCSADVASEDGMDWMVRIKGTSERICSSKNFYLTGKNSCPLNYSMEVPNNRTLNLIVDPRIAILGNEYCCQFDNGAGKKSCSYLNISLATDPAVTDDITTVFPHKNITASEEPPANGGNYKGLIVGIILGIVGVLAIIIITALVFRFWKPFRKSTVKDPKSGDLSDMPLNQSPDDSRNQS